jgi:hypothetical protein
MWFAQDAVTTYTYTTTTNDNSGIWAALGAMWLLWLVVAVVAIVALWKIFNKAGEAGWKSIIPLYNQYIILKIVGRPGWWLLLYFVPIVNIIISLIIAIDLAKSFGKSDLFGVVALWLFSLVGYLILGFGSAQYNGPSVGGGTPSPTPASQA